MNITYKNKNTDRLIHVYKVVVDYECDEFFKSREFTCDREHKLIDLIEQLKECRDAINDKKYNGEVISEDLTDSDWFNQLTEADTNGNYAEMTIVSVTHWDAFGIEFDVSGWQ